MSNLNILDNNSWQPQFDQQQQKDLAKSLESGQVLYFPNLPFELTDEEKQFTASDTESMKSKNVSYNPVTGQIKGIICSPKMEEMLRILNSRFYTHTKDLLSSLFPFYEKHLLTGMTSLRPIEIQGRLPDSYKKDDTRLHIDAFPSRPNRGKRILRVFSNVNQHGVARVWRVGEPFQNVANSFFEKFKKPFIGKAMLSHKLGLTKGRRTLYDSYMLQLHDLMKGDMDYQNAVKYEEVHMAPGATWIVLTDCVSHAVLSGQNLMEQTFYLPFEDMVKPELSPLYVLQRLAGKKLA